MANEIYTGTLIQGKRTTPNHKVKKCICKDKNEWVRVDGTHEAIISISDFMIVQQLLKEDTCISPKCNSIYPYAGRIFCGECGNSARRKTSKGYVYYVCGASSSSHRNGSKQSIRADILDEAILATVQAHIKVILDMEKALQKIDAISWEKRELEKIEQNIMLQEEIIEKNNSLKIGIYEDLQEGILSKDEFLSLKKEFSERIQQAETVIEQFKMDKINLIDGLQEQHGWLAQFKKYENISEINRSIVVALIEKIVLHDDNQIEVIFKQQDRFANIMEFIKTKQTQTSIKQDNHRTEAV